jgi:hypothetical protein
MRCGKVVVGSSLKWQRFGRSRLGEPVRV